MACGINQRQLSMSPSVSSHAQTTDRLWMAVPSDGNPQRFPSTSFLYIMSLGPLHLTTVLLFLREDQSVAVWPEVHPCPSSHILFPAHPYSDLHGRVAFVNFGCQVDNQWTSCGKKFMWLSFWSISLDLKWQHVFWYNAYLSIILRYMLKYLNIYILCY